MARRRRLQRRLLLLVALAACLVPACAPATTENTAGSSVAPSQAPSSTVSTSTAPPQGSTSQSTIPSGASGRVEIVGEQFHLGGQVTNQAGRAEGLLLNSRMVQAVIDIEGGADQFAYPGTGVWDAERNTDEFVAALPAYAAAGLDAVTINLQGGNPLDAPVDDRPDWRISAYADNGSLDPAWMGRLDRVLRAADDEGLAVIVGLFYFGQDHGLADETSVVRAVDNVVDWLGAGDYGNVMIEICNECNVHYDHAILQPDGVAELMARVRERGQGILPVSASLTGGNLPSRAWIEASDFVLLHGNRQDAASIAGMVAELRASPAFVAAPKPIVFNEDSTDLDNMDAAVTAGAGWGYHDKGSNDYLNGFQAPPVNWSINTESKIAFFEAVRALTR